MFNPISAVTNAVTQAAQAVGDAVSTATQGVGQAVEQSGQAVQSWFQDTFESQPNPSNLQANLKGCCDVNSNGGDTFTA